MFWLARKIFDFSTHLFRCGKNLSYLNFSTHLKWHSITQIVHKYLKCSLHVMIVTNFYFIHCILLYLNYVNLAPNFEYFPTGFMSRFGPTKSLFWFIQYFDRFECSPNFSRFMIRQNFLFELEFAHRVYCLAGCQFKKLLLWQF